MKNQERFPGEKMLKVVIISDRKREKESQYWFCGHPMRIQRISPGEVNAREMEHPRRVVLAWESCRTPSAKEKEIMAVAFRRGVKIAVFHSGDDPDFLRHFAPGAVLFPAMKDEDSMLTVIRGLVAEALGDSAPASSWFTGRDRSRRLEALGFFATGIAHDFNNILGVIYGFSELALDEIGQELPAAHYIEKIIKSADQAGELVRQLVTFGRHREGIPSSLKAIPILKEILKRLSSMDIFQFTVETRIARLSSDLILAEPVEFQQMVMTACRLLVRDLGPSGGRMVVSVKDEERPGTESPHLCIEMNVEGEKDQRDTSGDPDPGLSVCHEIIGRFGGTIKESRNGKQLTGLTIRLKRPGKKPRKKQAWDQKLPLANRMYHVLFVDDEPSLVEIGEKRIQKMGHRVTALHNSVEAYRLFSESPESYDIVITDMSMPGWNGLQLSRRIFKLRPDMPVIICTGYYSPVNRGNYRKLGIRDLLIKPVEYKKLAHSISGILDDMKNAKGSKKEKK